MRILEYTDLDTAGVTAQYKRVVDALARDDFRAAEVKKLANAAHEKLYRAKLDDADRLVFKLLRHDGQTSALMLEVIRNHNYAGSRFLRGALIDESKIVDVDASTAAQEAQPVRYLHPQRTQVHFLDKPISFDDAQEAIYRLSPPLVVVGSAGSGKTALTLEKLKQFPGEVLYVTQSAYLAQNARDLYYASGFERDEQEAVFLSYREFLESVRVPAGREATWRDFSGWFARMRQGQAFKGIDAHQAFEEIRGVLSAQAGGVLTRQAYAALGVRQSIFSGEDRGRLYDLFERYRAWLTEARLYDVNLVAHEWLALAAPRYDFVVVDEVQDLTMVQLALVLKTLKHPHHFMLCGDSNQIVHPNFFSWAQVKSLFWHDSGQAEHEELRVLSANFRNGTQTTHLANTLLKIKQQRFGSVDRETNYLVKAVGGESGETVLLPDQPDVKRELDRRTRQSAQVAVLVMRDEDKAAAREHFSTPLLFSIHEAKGLEYENIVLHGFVSAHRREFGEIAAGVTPEDLEGDELEYRRARDKSDKSLEVYKFFVNALYVALTRAVKNVYLIESDAGHPLFKLLGLSHVQANVQVEARQSTLEEWQVEARRLELQGKQEQADSIRRDILKQTPPPWPVLGEPEVRELMGKVFREPSPGEKTLRRLAEYAAFHDLPAVTFYLARETGYGTAKGGGPGFDVIAEKHRAIGRRLLEPYGARNIREVLRQCETYGLEHRTPMGQTPLMAAAAAGNVPLVEALLERGADREAVDAYGHNALHLALREMFRDKVFAHGPGPVLYDRLAPPFIDLKSSDRLVRIDRHLSEYFMFQTFWTLIKKQFSDAPYAGQLVGLVALDTKTLLEAWAPLPESVLRSNRNKRSHISNVLSRNEVEREYAYNRGLFKRAAHGKYQLNPSLEVRCRTGAAEQAWKPVAAALNLPLISEGTFYLTREPIRRWLESSGLPPCPEPLITERETARIAQSLGRPSQPLPAKSPAPWGNDLARSDALFEKRRLEKAQPGR